jgi:AcrR family transcriptional regulator
MSTTDATARGEQRAQRADARRNRERLLAAACSAFAEHGFDVGVAEIARRAGVGTGTFFRHFPTKLDLEVAVVLERKDAMLALVAEALAEPDPWSGFELAMTRSLEMMVCDRCIGQAASPELFADPRIQEMHREVTEGMEELLRRGREAGVIRPDVRPEDLIVLLTTIGATMERFDGADPQLWRRYLGVVLDGLRAAGAAPLTPGPPGMEVLDPAPASSPGPSSGGCSPCDEHGA